MAIIILFVIAFLLYLVIKEELSDPPTRKFVKYFIGTILGLFLLGQCVQAFAATKVKYYEPPKELTEVFNKLTAAAGIRSDTVEFFISSKTHVNATAFSSRRIEFTSGLLNVGNRGVDAEAIHKSVLAHEVAHIRQAIIGSKFDNNNGTGAAHRNYEREADYMALEILEKSGLGCEGAGELHFMNDKDGYPRKIGGSHPPEYERAVNAEKYCKILKTTGELPNDMYYE